MILFHGGLSVVEEPRIMSRASYRPLDFGTGFHTERSLSFLKKVSTAEVPR